MWKNKKAHTIKTLVMLLLHSPAVKRVISPISLEPSIDANFSNLDGLQRGKYYNTTSDFCKKKTLGRPSLAPGEGASGTWGGRGADGQRPFQASAPHRGTQTQQTRPKDVNVKQIPAGPVDGGVSPSVTGECDAHRNVNPRGDGVFGWS